jgi:hypothetical protein
VLRKDELGRLRAVMVMTMTMMRRRGKHEKTRNWNNTALLGTNYRPRSQKFLTTVLIPLLLYVFYMFDPPTT